MKRNERKKWRELVLIAQRVASSTDYAQEYMTKVEFTNKLNEISKLVHGDTSHLKVVK